MERLDLTNYADNSFQLSLKEGSKGKRPVFLPATINLKDAFRYYLDIRSCPKKVHFDFHNMCMHCSGI